MATIKIKRIATAVPASLLYGELGIAANVLYFGNSGDNPIKLALDSDIPTVNDATLTLATSGLGISGSDTFTANASAGTTFTIASNAVVAGTASTIVYRGTSGEITAGLNGFITGPVQMKHNTTTLSLDFIFS